MPRTTLDLDESVLRAVKRLARETGKSIGEIVSELLASVIGKTTVRKPQKVVWKTQSMQARVDLEDKDALYRALDAG